MLLSNKLRLLFIAYFGAVSLLRWQVDWTLLWWWIGGGLGMAFIIVERLLYVYYSKPHEQLSEQIKQLMRIRRYWDGLRLLRERRGEQGRLIVRSVVFMAVWVPMAFFVITSTGSMLASGLVMAIGLHLLYDTLSDFGDLRRLKGWLFWPIQREITDAEVKVVVAVYAGFFFLVTWMVV